MMKAIKNKEIAIVGGGPGGLTLSRLLQVKGANIKVYERDENEHVRVQGATLDLHYESGLAALKEAGLMDAFWKAYRPGADKLRVMDKQGNVLLDEADSNTSEEHFRPEIDRGPLRKLLLDGLQPGTVIWDSQFVTMQPQDKGWQLEFKGGKTAYADLVIAADGANSRIRPSVTDIQPSYSGYTVVEGYVYSSKSAAPHIHQLLNGGKIFVLDDSKSIIVSSKGDGSFVFYTGSKTDENWVKTSGIDFNNKQQVIAWFKETFSGWYASWGELFEKAEPKFVPRPQYCMPPNQHWEAKPNVTLLGDAAHLMPPYAGEGVNMAMQDALELAQSLTNPAFGTLQEAIEVYENKMRKRAGEIATVTLEQTEKLHTPGAAKYLVQMMSGNPE